MEKEIARAKTINNRLASLIISLHEKGYTEDFFIDGKSLRLASPSLQTCLNMPFTIVDIDECYDDLTGSGKYIQTVETSCGLKGILISEIGPLITSKP